MKKLVKLFSAAVLLLPTKALAQLGPGNCPDELVGTPACTQGLAGLITMISNTILLIVGVIAVLFLIIGGFQYITSAGNPEQVGKAKNTILYAIIGILVTLLAWAVVQFVVDKMT